MSSVFRLLYNIRLLNLLPSARDHDLHMLIIHISFSYVCRVHL